MLDAAVADALEGLGGGPAVELAALAALPRGPRAAGAARAGGARPPAGRDRSPGPTRTTCWRWASGRARSLDLGGGLQAVAEYGTLRFRRPKPPPPRPSR